jgi:hypothetical protein
MLGSGCANIPIKNRNVLQTPAAYTGIMNPTKTFLSTPGNGVARASLKSDGEWQVEYDLPSLKVAYLAAGLKPEGAIYAGTKGDGVFRSLDRGKTWQPAGLEGKIVKALGVDPQDPETVYAGCRPISMYVTHDGGASWQELESFRRVKRWWMFSPADPGSYQPYVQAISISPTNPDVILAGIELGAVVRSEDGGKTWSSHLKGTLRDCHTLKFHGHDGRWAYEAGGTGGGATISSDGGRTWHKSKDGLAKNYGVACGSDPERPDIWYVSVAPSPGKGFSEQAEVYLYRSGDPHSPQNGSTNETSWEPIGWEPHPISQMPTALVTIKNAPGHLYAGLGYGDVWHTPDYGDTWEKLPFSLGGIWSSLLVLEGAV